MAFDNNRPADSRITDVTVYLSGAQVVRTASREVEAGAQTVIFKPLPAALLPDSVQVAVTEDGGTGLVIQAVEYTVDYLQEADRSEDIARLSAELEALRDRRLEEEARLELCDLEEDFLRDNRRLAGEKNGLKAAELREAAEFFAARMEDIKTRRLAGQRTLRGIDEEIDSLSRQLGIYSTGRAIPVGAASVTLAAAQAGRAALTLSYYIADAGWSPSYDIRATDTDGPIALHYKAGVWQNTHEDWEDVRLTLSTGAPAAGGELPELRPWYIDFDRPAPAAAGMFQSFNKQMAKLSVDRMAADMEDVYDMETLKAAPEAPPPATVEETLTSVEYGIPAPFSAASGGGARTVEILTHSLPATYRYYSVRKLEKEVFLLAAVRGWQGLNLVAGEAGIFFGNTYVGKTYIDPRRADEEIRLSLGTDKGVVVTRVRGKDFTAGTIAGGGVKNTRQWELTVRNLKKHAIDMELRDQLPVSRNKQITVDAVETAEADYNKDTGILTWKLTLEPAEARSMTVKYVVTQPKNTVVALE